MKIFNENGIIYRIFNFLGNLIALNLCIVLGSVGIITMGPSIIAGLNVGLKLVDDNRVNITYEFVRSFKENIKQGIVLFFIFAFINSSLILYLFMFERKEILVFIALILLIFNSVFSFIFMLAGSFHNSVIGLIKGGFVVFFLNIKRTVFAVALTAVTIFITFYNIYTVYFLIGYYLFIGFGIFFYLNSKIFSKIIKEYKNKSRD